MLKGKLLILLPLSLFILALFVGPVTGAGVSLTNGVPITSPFGSTSPVVTITDSDIAQNGTITIDVTDLHQCTAGFALTNDNIMVTDSAANAVWTGIVEGNNLNLTSVGNDTVIGETVTVTFTGAHGSPWIADTYGPWEFHPLVTRSDGQGSADFTFLIETVSPAPTDLVIADGSNITATDGLTSPIITITGSDIAQDLTISIDVSAIDPIVAGGSFTSDNVIVNDTAMNANWNGTVNSDILTLTSGEGPTLAGETVTVTFSGARNPWIANTSGSRTIPLTAVRSDGFGSGTFSLVINISPPPGPIPHANFSASPTSDLAPLVVSFTDTSLNGPTTWSWDFGDGSNSTDQNPVHTYTHTGTYSVSLTASNIHGFETLERAHYITVLNGAVKEATTSIAGLTVSGSGSEQMITVDTSILPAALIPNASVLEIRPPADKGLENITVYALNEAGFSQNGALIVGRPTGVHLVSGEIAPPDGFSNGIGTNSTFNYTIDLLSYPPDARLTTKIREGVTPHDDSLLRRITSGNDAFIVGTAYTAGISKTNFPSGTHAKIHMSVNASWNPSLSGGPGRIYIWRISDDESSGEIRPTTYLHTDPLYNLDYYEADSPGGLSTFGISSLSGNNNPFQLITLTLSSIISEPQQVNNNPNLDTASKGSVPVTVAKTLTPEITLAVDDPGSSAKLYANSHGTITQATILRSTDGLATLSLGLGIVAKDRDGKPLASVSIARIPPEKVPQAPSGSTLPGAISAYELQPDGAVFSPGIPLNFAPQPGTPFGQEFTVKTYDSTTGIWKEIPTIYDPRTGTVTAQVSHFCAFALFARPIAAEPSATVTRVQPQPVPTTASPPPSNAMSIVGGMFVWLVNLVSTNLLIVAFAIILTGSVVLYRRKQGGEW
jgi:PKD repeat protein